MSKSEINWLLWSVLFFILGGVLGFVMLSDRTDKTFFMPGDLSSGHHQLADNCSACHSDAFGGGEVLQQSCIDCHGKDRVKPFDSHPAKKFTDPRNADLLESINALQCVSCHSEHKPEITVKDGLTQPKDVCFHCHQTIATERPSHQGMGFDTCKDSGCHNFHNNRALYTDFLIKHLDEPVFLGKMFLPEKEFISVIDEVVEYPHDKYPLKKLVEADIDAKERLNIDHEIKDQWLTTAHAQSGVNCSACHIRQNNKPDSDDSTSDEEESPIWEDHPDHTSCESCHSVEVGRFFEGKHGMRLKQGLTPMTPADARLPMKKDSAHQELTCNSCHGAHEFDIQQAAVESCLGCHDDQHSLAYKASPHYSLWKKEIDGEADAGSGVSCASCHMPRVNYDVSEWMSRTIVDHNQSANLSPNTKMIRSSCQHCHGLEFTLDSLADESLIENNFSGLPDKHIPTMDLANKEKIRRQEAAAKRDETE